jgi:hypothetical protein
MDIATVPEWNATTSYAVGAYVKRSYSDPLVLSYAEISASVFNYGLGTDVYTGSNSDFLNSLYYTYGYQMPSYATATPTITYSTPPTTSTYLGTSYPTVQENNTTIEAVYTTRNYSSGTVVNWSLGTFPAGSLIPQKLFVFPTSGKSIVGSNLKWSLKVNTVENFSTQTVGTQGFKLPFVGFSIIVADSSTGTATASSIAKYTMTEFPYKIYTNRSFPVRIQASNDVPTGQVTIVKLYGVGSISGVELDGVAVSTTPTTVLGYSGVQFNATVFESRVFIVRLKSSATGVVGFALYEGTTLLLNQSSLVFTDSVIINTNPYGFLDYALPSTDYGIQIFSSRTPKQVTYNTSAVTWNQVDIFTAAANSTTTKSYGSFLADREIKAQQIFLNAPPVDRKAVAHTITITKSGSGATVRVSGGSEQAQILVLMR